VGDGLLMGLARLMSEQGAQQRLIVLATDGRSSIGQDPMQVAQLVAGQGIKLYTIGIGRKGGAIIQQQDVFGRLQQYRMEEPDEGTLSGMARVTGGRYFRATDSAGLKGIYSDIAGAERREIKVKKRRDADEQFYPFLWAGALLLLIEALLRLRVRVSA
jgi:Ca-activated chloride channel family protein